MRRYWSLPLLAFVDAAHDGYSRLAHPVRHRRLVFWIARRYWVVCDVLSGTGSHEAESFFHFAPMAAMLDGDGLACSAIRSGVGLCIVPFPDEGLEVELRCGETNPPRGWVSFAYGHKEPAPVLIYRRRGTVPLLLGAVLWPYEGQAPSPRTCRVEVKRSGDTVSSSSAGSVRIEVGNGSVDQVLWQDAVGLVSAGELTTDAEVALVRARRGERPCGVCVPRGILRWRGEEVDTVADDAAAPRRLSGS